MGVRNDTENLSSATLFAFNRNGLALRHPLVKAETIGSNPRTVLGALAPLKDGSWGYRDAHLAKLTTRNGQPVTGDVRLYPGDIIAYRAGEGVQERTVFKMFYAETGGRVLEWNQLPLTQALPEISIACSGDAVRLFNFRMEGSHAFLKKTDLGHVLVLQEGAPVKVNGILPAEKILLNHLDIIQIADSFFVYLSGTLWIGSVWPVALQSRKSTVRKEAPAEPAAPQRRLPPPEESPERPSPPLPAAPPLQAAEEKASLPEAQVNVQEAQTQVQEAQPQVQEAQAQMQEAQVQEAVLPPEEAASEAAEKVPEEVPGEVPEDTARNNGDEREEKREAEKKETPDDPRKENSPEDHPVSAIRHDAAFHGAGLDIEIRERNVRKGLRKRTLLRDIRLQVVPGDFVLILGGSGAGKSTFIKSVMGYDRADADISYGSLDVYRDYEKVKYEIGYVPQQNLIRLNYTVYDTLYAEAKMKMPGTSTRQEYVQQVDWAMSLLGLKAEKNNLCASISGGQLKRLSIAIELVGDPGIFFLDEPDSGLDGTMSRLLMENLKEIADLGKMVMIITHGPDRAADLFTRILVLGKTADNVGHLLFYGSVKDALSFFEVDSLEHIVKRINSKAEGGEGLADYFLEKYTALQQKQASLPKES
jgi:ABC-type multidrug transport system ATPase subunit